ncbi:hypothetical protein Efla_001373 [Eimeria flavescens]
MLKYLLLPHLNAALSAVFEDLETHQIEASILGGTLALRNLKIKSDALAPLSLPINIAYGHVGTLVVKLNLLRLVTEPILVCAEDVLLLAVTQPSSTWSVAREQSIRDKQRNLLLLTDECLTYAREESGLPSVLQRVVYAVIHRIRLSIKGLELRLEDTETASSHPFAFGLRASRLYNTQCSPGWKSNGSGMRLHRESAVGAVSSSTAVEHPSAAQPSSSWFGWISSLVGRNRNEDTPPREGIPESFQIKTVLEDAAIYLDPLDVDGPSFPWLPYPASYRQQILSSLNEFALKRGFLVSSLEASLPIPFGKPVDGGGPGCAKPVSIGTFMQALRGRIGERADPAVLVEAGAKECEHQEGALVVDKPKGQHRPGGRRRKVEAGAQPVAKVAGKADSSFSEEDLSLPDPHQSSERELPLRISDLYSPHDLLQLATLNAPNHFYVIQPINVEIWAQCAQRPSAVLPWTSRTFSRPFGPASSDTEDGERQPFQRTVGNKAGAAGATETDEDNLAASMSIALVFGRVRLQLTAFQIASLCRWLHFALFLYQEFVSGVYAECLELVPSEEEVDSYKRAWEQHLVAYAVAAAGEAGLLGSSGREHPPATTVTSGTSKYDVCEDDLDKKSIDEIINTFQAKYWPTVTLPIRQEVLKNLQEQARFRRCGHFYDKDKTGMAHAKQTPRSLDHESGNTTSGQLLENVAGELAKPDLAPAGADWQVLRCIENMRQQRFSKSVHFSVEFNGLEISLSATYGVEQCLCIEFKELMVHTALYYDLRTSVIATCEGVHVKDDLLPNLEHREVLTGEPPLVRQRSLQEVSDGKPWSAEKEKVCVGGVLASDGQALFETSSLCSSPTVSPLQSDGRECLLDWNSTCFGSQCGCSLDWTSGVGLDAQEEKATTVESQAGGWIRVVKVYVPVEGIPDVVFHMQTHGSLFCTVTPTAVAFLVQTLQEPVCLVEKGSLLELASREVQEVIHRNELFMAKLLLGDFEHISIDLCVDIPMPHQLLLPFNYRDSKCRGLLLNSGTVFVDTILKRPRSFFSTACDIDSFESYDRYLVAVSGACVQRVLDCRMIRRLPKKPQKKLTVSSDSKKAKVTQPRDTSCTSRSTSPRCAQMSERRGSRRQRIHPQTAVDEESKKKLEGTPDRLRQEPATSENQMRGEETFEGQDFIVWPAGIVCCADKCHFPSPSYLPTFRLLIQDQAFSGLCISLSDGDLVAVCGLLAEVLALLQPLLTLGSAPSPPVEPAGQEETVFSSNAATTTSEDSSVELTQEDGIADLPERQFRLLHGKRITSSARVDSGQSRHTILRAGISGELSGVPKPSTASLNGPSRYSALRRITTYIHRTLRAPAPSSLSSVDLLDPQDPRLHSPSANPNKTVWNRCIQIDKQLPAGLRGLAGEKASSSSDAPDIGTGVLDEQEILSKNELGKHGCNTGSTLTADHEPAQAPAKRLVNFEVRVGLSLFELLLLKENRLAFSHSSLEHAQPCANSVRKISCATTNGVVNHPAKQGTDLLSSQNNFVLRFGVEGARLWIYSAKSHSCCKCLATLSQVHLSMAHGKQDENTRGKVKIEQASASTDRVSEAEARVGDFRRTSRPSTSGSQPSPTGGTAYLADDMGRLAGFRGEARGSVSSPLLSRRFPNAVPVLQFRAPVCRQTKESVASAADAAAALLLSSSCQHSSAFSKNASHSVSFTALQSALSSHRLRTTTRWTFPPPYPVKHVSGMRVQEGADVSMLQQHDSSTPYPVDTAVSRGKTKFGTAVAFHGHTREEVNATQVPVASVFESFPFEPEAEEVLVEDLISGRCFLVPCSIHASVASDKAWQVLTRRVPDVIVQATLCLDSFLHTLDARCNPLRITLDWMALAEATGNLEARLSAVECGIPPWRVRVSVVLELCEIILPTCTASPYADLPHSPAWFPEVNSPPTTITCEPPHGVKFLYSRLPGRPQFSPSADRSSSGHPTWSRWGLNAQGDVADLSRAFGLSGRGGEASMQEALVAVCPPVLVMSSSLSASYYLESRHIEELSGHLCGEGAEMAGTNESKELGQTKQSTTGRLLCNVQRMRTVFLQSPRCLQDHNALIQILHRAGIMHLRSCVQKDGLPRLSRCLRPPIFGSCGVPFITLLDMQKHFLNLDRAGKGGPAEVKTLLLQKSASPALKTNAHTHNPSPQAPHKIRRKGGLASMEQEAISVHTLIDGSRLRFTASYSLQAGREKAKDLFFLCIRNDFSSCIDTRHCRSGEEAGNTRWTDSARDVAEREVGRTAVVEVLIETDPLIVNLTPPVMAAGASLLQLVGSTFATGQTPAAAETCPELRVPLTSSGRAAIDDTAPSNDVAYSHVGRMRSMQSSEGCGVPSTRDVNLSKIRRASGGLGCCTGPFNDTTEDRIAKKASGEAARWIWTLFHSIDALISLRIRAECMRLETPSFQIVLEDVETSGILKRPDQNVPFCFLPPLEDLDHRDNERSSQSVRYQPMFSGQRLKDPAAQRRRRGKSHFISADSHNLEAAACRQPQGRMHVKENLLSLGLRFMLSAEALDKSRMAFESILEPWNCSWNLKYVRFPAPVKCPATNERLAESHVKSYAADFTAPIAENGHCCVLYTQVPADYLLALPAQVAERTGAWQLTKMPSSLRTTAFSGGGPDLKDRVSLAMRKPQAALGRTSIRSPVAASRDWCAHRAAHSISRIRPRRRSSQANEHPIAESLTAMDRTRCLQALAKTWGRYGAELQCEVACSWLNVTIAPFFFDAILETAELTEAAHRSMGVQLTQ